MEPETGKNKKKHEPGRAENSLNALDKEVTQVFLGISDKLKRRMKPPKSAKLIEAVLTHQMGRIANQGVKTKMCSETD